MLGLHCATALLCRAIAIVGAARASRSNRVSRRVDEQAKPSGVDGARVISDAEEQGQQQDELLEQALRVGVVGSGFCKNMDLSAMSHASSLLAVIVPNHLLSIMARPSILKNIDSYKGLEGLHLVFDRHPESSAWRLPLISVPAGGLKGISKLKRLAVSVVGSPWPGMPTIRKTSRISTSSRWKETDQPLKFLLACMPPLPFLKDLSISYGLPPSQPILDFIQGLDMKRLRTLKVELPVHKIALEVICTIVDDRLSPCLESITLAHTTTADAWSGLATERLLKLLLQDGAQPCLRR